MVMTSTLYQGNIKLPLYSDHWKIKEFYGIRCGPHIKKICQNEKNIQLHQQKMPLARTIQDLLFSTII